MASLRYTLAFLFLLAPAAAGCGNDLTAAERYRRDANTICREGRKAGEAVAPPRSPGALAGYLERVLEIGIEYNRRYERLDPPAGLRPEHDALVRSNERGERVTRRLVREVRASENPVRTLQRRIPELLRLVRRSNELSRKAGLRDCLQTIAPPGSPEAGPS